MSIEQTLAERGGRYGDFSIHAEIAQNLQDDMRRTKGWERLSPAQKQALTVIADKIGRILSGDPCYADNWHDIQGYAKLVEDRIVDVSKDPAEEFVDKLNKSREQEGLRKISKACQFCGAANGHGGLDCPHSRPYATYCDAALGAASAYIGSVDAPDIRGPNQA